ncbi:hypothetical protein AVDCRST_MAG82-798, partial [uncultured Rubrobacteraceae bacterium]
GRRRRAPGRRTDLRRGTAAARSASPARDVRPTDLQARPRDAITM